MSLGLLYWILMLLWLVFSLWAGYPYTTHIRPFGGSMFLFVLLLIIGWKIFGSPISG